MKLKDLRLSKNIPQKEIAEQLGVIPRTIRKWESGASEPKISQLIQIADLFDVSIDYLVERTDNPKRL